jgi:hypothetical protein
LLDEPFECLRHFVVELQQHHVTRLRQLDELGVRKPFRDPLAVRERRDLVASTCDDDRGHRPDRLQRGVLLVSVEAGEEVRHDVERGGGEHLVGEVDVLLRHLCAERQAAGHHEADVRPHSAATLDQPRRTGHRGHDCRRQPVDETTRQPRQPQRRRLELTGAGRDQGDPEDLRPEQLGVLLGERHDRHPTHRVADEHDRVVAGELVDHGGEVATEVVDRAVLVAGTGRAAVRTLVVEHEPVLGAHGQPLEVPAVEVEGVAVHEHDGDRAVSGSDRFVDLGVQLESVFGDHGVPGASNRTERLSGRSTFAGDQLALGEDAGRRAGGEHADRRSRDPGVAHDHAALVGVAHDAPPAAASPT